MTAGPEIFSPSYYERLDLLERRHWWCRSVRRVALRMIEPLSAPTGIVLDAGCGTGGLLAAMAARHFSLSGVGADVSIDALARARGHGVERLIDASVVALPVMSEGVDLVVSNDVLQHLPEGEDARAVAETHRVLKPGGFFCVRSNLGTPVAAGPSLHRRYDRPTLSRLVQAGGFSILEHRVLHPLAGWWASLHDQAPGEGEGEGEHKESGHGLSLVLPAAPINAAIDLYTRLEDAIVRRLPFGVPHGDAQIVLAQKPRRA
jgi:SAM-dependent methyltransferase